MFYTVVFILFGCFDKKNARLKTMDFIVVNYEICYNILVYIESVGKKHGLERTE